MTIELFLAVVAFVGLERIVELVVSRRNLARLLAQGGRQVHDDGYPLLVVLHAGFFPAILAERFLAPWAGAGPGTLFLLAGFALAEALRLWAIGTLGDRWTTRVVVLPDAPLVDEGPYRFLDHPNYVAVTLELALLPLAFGCWATAVGASILNAIALRGRLQVEEAALERASAADA